MAIDRTTKTFAVTLAEGGFWIRFSNFASVAKTMECQNVHAIMFEDGSVWDVVNGWRSGEADVEFLREIFKEEDAKAVSSA